jgi:hypothetical protein
MASLRTLQYALQPFAQELLRVARTADSTFRVTSSRRSYQDQARLYQAFLDGKSELPAAPPGKSLHEFGLAFDLARPGVQVWEDDLLPQLGALWNSWGGHWSKTDPVHFEVRL